MATYITSDWHFGHQREFLYGPRGFTNVYDMNKAIIERHNAIVQPDDDVYVLGDLMLNDDVAGMACIKQLKGNIHVVRGNHDSANRMQLYNDCYNIVEVTEGQYLNYRGYHFYLSHYPCLCSNFDFEKPLKSSAISLAGHSHVQDPFADWNKGLIFHCEMDTNNCTPWLLDDVIEKIKNKCNER